MSRFLPSSRRRRTSAGQGLVEGAIVISILLILSVSFIDFANLIYAYLELGDGVAQATRYAITGRVEPDPARSGYLSREESIRVALHRALPTLKINDADVVFKNLTTGAANAGGKSDLINVTVSYRVPLISPVLLALYPSKTITLRQTVTMKNEPFPSS